MAQAKARHPEWEDRFFNVGFILDPQGEVILQHYKTTPLFPVEHSVCPHDIYDWWVDRYGRNLDAFWPVVDTPIGRMGIMMANEGSYPENARALAMNGAELVYRASIPHPAASNDYFEVQTRARALDNNMYVLAPNVGTYYLTADSDTPIDTFGGASMIVDYRGQIVGKHPYSGVSSWVCGPVNIEALRHHRSSSLWTNWMKDLRTELYQIVYENPIYPKNLYLEREPYKHAEYRREVIDKTGGVATRARHLAKASVAAGLEPPPTGGGVASGRSPERDGRQAGGSSCWRSQQERESLPATSAERRPIH